MRYSFVFIIALRIVVVFNTGIAKTQKTFRESIYAHYIVSFQCLVQICMCQVRNETIGL